MNAKCAVFNLLAGRCLAPYLLAIVSTALATLVFAHESATGVVKERMDLMKGQQRQMKLIGDMAKGKRPFDAAQARKAASDIGTSTGEIPRLFPKGSNGQPSEALDAIWEEWDQFERDAAHAQEAANELAAALERGNEDWRPAFRAMIDACKSCHESFRAERSEHSH